MTDRESESRIVNESAEAICDRFKSEGREVDAVVIVVLFKTPGEQRVYHVAQSIDAADEAAADELFCECAGRLNELAVKVAQKHHLS